MCFPAPVRLALFRLAGDRHGVTALTFAVSAVVLLGFVALATEVGIWYLTRVQAYNAADAAAIAGALAVVAGDDPVTAATYVAQQNGYTAAAFSAQCTPSSSALSVCINNPPVSGNYAPSGTPPTNLTAAQLATATEVMVSIPFVPILARLFTGGTTITVSARAVAIVGPVDNACVVSLTGELDIATPQQTTACALTANNTGTAGGNPTGIDISSDFSSGVPFHSWVFKVDTTGYCHRDDNTSCDSLYTGGHAGHLNRPDASYQPPTTNPYAATIFDPATATDYLSLPASSADVQPVSVVASSITATVVGGSVTAVTVGNGGAGYAPSAPGTTYPLVFSGGGGTGAAGTYTVNASGAVDPAGVVITNGGTGYTLPPTVTLSTQPITFSLPAAYALVPATAGLGDAVAGMYNGIQYNWTTSHPYYAYTSDLTIPSGVTVTLAPGTYLFVNASLTVQSGATMKCWDYAPVTPGACGPVSGTGVTIVLAGSSPGNLTIDSGATVVLGAPPANTPYPALGGVLFYRDGQGQPPGGNTTQPPVVNIAGGSNTILNGVMYFPDASVAYSANGQAGGSGLECSILVAGTVSLSGAGLASEFKPSCDAYGRDAADQTAVPFTQAAMIVE